MNKVWKSKTITATVNKDSKTVYDFISNPENLPKWAKTFCLSITKKGNNWAIETKQGPVELRMAEKNEFGVADHYLRPLGGDEIYVPMRVVSNGTGCELIFTVFQYPHMTEESFAKDVSLVEQDLQTLKSLFI